MQELHQAGDEENLGNFRPIPVLLCFSKIIEKIVYNRLYEHLTMNDIHYEKQFRFQEGHSTEHAVIQLIDQINSSFELLIIKF